MDIRSIMAARNYVGARPATEAIAGSTEGNRLERTANDFTATLQDAESTALKATAGEADPHALVQALAQAELAVETAVTVRDKVVEAYQEILRMPV
jgi:flagellar hook-basal body complex protein FliE